MSGELKSDIRVLNARSADNTSKQTTVPTAGKQQDAVSVSQQLQKLMLRMKGEFMKEDGTGVNYSALKLSDVFKSYKAITQDLIGISLETLDRTQKMVFFINIYNALTIHGLVECDKLPNSVLDIRQFWRNTAYNISGHIFSLDDIEHGILRGNRPHPAANDPHFSSKDPRVKFVVEPMDPRIHFALVCGAKSCPPINVYSEKNLDHALTMATRNFVEQETTVNMKFKEIELSRIFQWYRTDFGADEIEAVRWTLKYLCEDKVYGIETMLDVLLLEGGVRISYSDYNWQLNKA
ncbi:uncharacterized protein [Ptychodera flava]|uniref:uncharacterized protein isoform X1 n=1 Tax=Ptychodera flava TaxID=63121 RepID=UPI00396A12B6